MKTLRTQSISRSAAGCSPIVLREGEQVRLVFMPMLVENPQNPKASVDGHFIYQRKAKSGRWLPVRTASLATLKSGEGFKLALHAHELRTLLEALVPLYRFYEQQGIPHGDKTFVQVDGALAKFVSLGERDLTALLESNADDATTMLLTLVNWVATSTGRREVTEKLLSLAPERLPAVTTLLGLVTVKDALAYWKKNQENDSEEFWQQSLSERTYVLSQVFAYPVVVIGSKAYVGGKQVSNVGGKEVDFLVSTESTHAVILMEIKTPQTKLLGREYRNGVFPLSRGLSGAVAQVLRQRQSLMRTFDSIVAERTMALTLGEPGCVVIAGNTAELVEPSMRENFELQRERVHGVTIITYDELFRRLERLVALIEAG